MICLASGADWDCTADGNVFVWHKTTGIPIGKIQAHEPRCNAGAWNPADPRMFVTGGDDGKIKM